MAKKPGGKLSTKKGTAKKDAKGKTDTKKKKGSAASKRANRNK